MVDPIHGRSVSKAHQPLSAAASPAPVDPATLNSIGNNLWLSIYMSLNGSSSADPLQFAMAMKAIQQFMSAYPTPPTGNPYLLNVWEDLNGTDGLTNESLATMASRYATSGFQQTELVTFNTYYVGDTSPRSNWADLLPTLNDWGRAEGGFVPSPTSPLTRRDFENLLNDFPLTASDYAQFLADVNTIEGKLAAAPTTPPLDGCCQFLKNLFETPLDPTAPNPGNTTLAYLALHGDVVDLTTYLTKNPNWAGEFQTYFNQIAAMEGWPHT